MKTQREPLFSPHDLATLAGLGAALIFVRHWLPKLPERVPTHWNAAGQVDVWAAKGQLYWTPLLMGLAVWLLLFVIGLFLRGGDARKQTGARAVRDFRGWLGCGVALMTGYLGPMAAVQGPRSIWVGLALLAGAIAVGFIPLTRLARSAPPIEGATEADYRLGGLLYWNPRDPRLWVEKRLGLGWTFNFARPSAWLMLAVLVAPGLVVIAVIALVTRH